MKIIANDNIIHNVYMKMIFHTNGDDNLVTKIKDTASTETNMFFILIYTYNAVDTKIKSNSWF